MAKVQKISIALTDDLAADVQAAVQSGEFATTSEVMRDALRLWRRERQERSAFVAELRTAWKDGLASGEVWELIRADLEAIKAKARGA
ncbi:type II toxin-antitoxin system ParD family antitoxin [Pseudonocardia sp. TMWB2A]|uniref:type II toxin-antitoxin system ParD family antitoxin n=1 Tax=Pseudonocardia sp. TMWB2A TaxID=687430 RepID=UPI00307DF300